MAAADVSPRHNVGGTMLLHVMGVRGLDAKRAAITTMVLEVQGESAVTTNIDDTKAST